MKYKLFTAITAVSLLAITGCSTTGTFEAHDKYEYVAGYAFKTNLSCERKTPKDQFDRKCDYPRLGFKGFSPDPGFSVGSAGAGTGP
ncbi:hypothetical protein [Phyllobacterium myrsinacearum]|uniref:Lipoprotein n=1 Tax=Phyllobacterium myrsinacearum TaxID=28101 RepID=A0A839ETY2_9HYPH|nr:hypothetical protein [Phyllobacterium myrsinacearum]MBA8881638.1 hypothetical protein [Phyllobacterium myrsinacearum]